MSDNETAIVIVGMFAFPVIVYVLALAIETVLHAWPVKRK